MHDKPQSRQNESLMSESGRAREAKRIQRMGRESLNLIKAQIALVIRDWALNHARFKTKQAAADAIDEDRAMLSRIISGKLDGISTDKLVVIAGKTGNTTRVQSLNMARSGDQIGRWLTGLWSSAVDQVLETKLSITLDTEEALMDTMLNRLALYDSSEPSDRDLHMICTGKKWDIDLCGAFYRDVAATIETKKLRATRIFAGNEKTFFGNRALARDSAEAGTDTYLIDLRDCVAPQFVPPAGMGFWVLGKSTVLIHVSVEENGSYLFGEVNDGLLAACLDRAVYLPAKQLGVRVGDPAVSNRFGSTGITSFHSST